MAARNDLVAIPRLNNYSAEYPGDSYGLAQYLGDISGKTGIAAAIASLRARGTDAHLWLPGVGTLSGLTTGNYLESTGNTLGTVDNPTGLVLDALGTVGSELVTNGAGTNTDLWVPTQSTVVSVGGEFVVTATGSSAQINQGVSFVAGKSYVVTAIARCGTVVGPVYVGINGIGGQPVSATSNTPTRYQFTAASTGSMNVQVAVSGASAGQTFYVSSISVREVTGIHLTQGTTANKPVLRRGLTNLLTYSSDFTNAAWGKTNTSVTANSATAPDGTMTASVLTYSTQFGHLLSSYSPASGLPFTAAFWARTQSGTRTLSTYDNLGNPLGSTVVTTTWTLHVVNFTLASSTAIVFLQDRAASGFQPIELWRNAIFQGTLTASQIIAAGGIPVTTTAAASNPDAGKYSWAFDGSNDSLLTGNLGITNACTIVIAGRLDSLGSTTGFFVEDTLGIQLYANTSGSIKINKAGIVNILNSPAATVVAGVPLVVTLRISAGVVVIRKNGVEIASVAYAGTFEATTGARIGNYFNGVSAPLPGVIGSVIALPVALTDAECLLVERMAASQFPSGPVF